MAATWCGSPGQKGMDKDMNENLKVIITDCDHDSIQIEKELHPDREGCI